ncbi:MAG: hypothetical protein PQJ60_02115 [Spirochaetales bacterium]|nr:hypothetical protein [Spirochaetales bacterium]
MAEKNSKTAELRREITDLLGQIDEEGLLFLKKQASTIIYNQTVLEMNRKNQESLLENHQARNEKKSTGKSSEQKEGIISLDRSGEERGYCNVVCGNVRVFFTLDELDTMFYIAEKASAKGDGGLLLYRWLKKERGDFLVDNGITDYPSPRIDALADFLVSAAAGR